MEPVDFSWSLLVDPLRSLDDYCKRFRLVVVDMVRVACVLLDSVRMYPYLPLRTIAVVQAKLHILIDLRYLTDDVIRAVRLDVALPPRLIPR